MYTQLIVMQDATVTMAYGRRYGLVGRNGTGKTTLLRAMAYHQIKGIPENCQILHVEQEVSSCGSLAAPQWGGEGGGRGGGVAESYSAKSSSGVNFHYAVLKLLRSQGSIQLQLSGCF